MLAAMVALSLHPRADQSADALIIYKMTRAFCYSGLPVSY